jgi:hypothetical protein
MMGAASFGVVVVVCACCQTLVFVVVANESRNQRTETREWSGYRRNRETEILELLRL